MNRELTERWNERVNDLDTVYHLGDFALSKRQNIAGYRQRLRGRIILIRGNHDRSADVMRAEGFDEVNESAFVEIDGIRLFLRHIPEYDLNMWRSRANFHLCGHVHTAFKRQDRIINVGSDVWDYRPVSIAELAGA